MAGIATSIFLILLDAATKYRDIHPKIIWGLPVVGFFIAWVFTHYGKDAGRGSNLILDEIHDPKNVLPLRMAPLVLLATVLTHLFGGSVGREGTAVQMGASLGDRLSRVFQIFTEERKALLVSGAGAGFGAALGAPLAGAIFGMEFIRVGRLKPYAVMECFAASFVAYFTTLFFKVPHSKYPLLGIQRFDLSSLFYVLLAGILFGFTARVFISFTHFLEQQLNRIFKYSPLRGMIVGAMLVLLFFWEGSNRYLGLGIPVIQDAFFHLTDLTVPMLKGFFTGLTIAGGFKGGEFIPLVFMGTTLGSALSLWLPVSTQLMASVGFAAVFAGAANTPIACTLMAVEIFGFNILPYAFLACFTSYYFSGSTGIYGSQKKPDQGKWVPSQLMMGFPWSERQKN